MHDFLSVPLLGMLVAIASLGTSDRQAETHSFDAVGGGFAF
jgi:hypothetical protein